MAPPGVAVQLRTKLLATALGGEQDSASEVAGSKPQTDESLQTGQLGLAESCFLPHEPIFFFTDDAGTWEYGGTNRGIQQTLYIA
jgi:hypothetical protein